MSRAACCFMLVGLSAGMAARAAEPAAQAGAGSFVRALWLVQQFGSAEAASPRNDEHLKAVLAGALDKSGTLSRLVVEKSLMDAETFDKLSAPQSKLDPARVHEVLEANTPATRRRMLPHIAAHLDALTTSFDRLDEAHLAGGEKLVEWIVANYSPGQPLPILFVCTGNSRRSILGATMGNLAADYWGLPEVRCSSGGTAPSAFNRRAIAALAAIGVEVEPTGDEAPRGDEATPNPRYRVRWGDGGPSDLPAAETIEFSKHYSNRHNPQTGFAAVLVCSQADRECPFVKGAARRISMPYLDPKIYDDGEYEADKYAERRDDFGRLMLAVVLQARRRLQADGKLP